MGAAYAERLREVACIERQTTEPWARSSIWMYGIVLCDDSPLDARSLADRLARRGIETRPFFLGMHEQPALRERGLFAGERHPVAERLSRRGLYLPSGVALTEIQHERVCDAVRELLA
jgi:perosamine synthetase